MVVCGSSGLLGPTGPWLLADLGAGAVAGGEGAGGFLRLLWGPGLRSRLPAYTALPENPEVSRDGAWLERALGVQVRAVSLGPHLVELPSAAPGAPL